MNSRVQYLRLSCAHYFGGCCFVCFRKIGNGKGFTYHHLWYLKKEKRYKDFETQEKYYEYLVKKISANPKRFLLVCNKHHQSIERLNRFRDIHLERLLDAVKRTKT